MVIVMTMRKTNALDTKFTDMTTMIVQAVLSVFIDTTFLFGMPLLEGRGPSAGLENIKDKYAHISFIP